ncbi:hypothetical protein [Enterococcus avium]|uniref:hypothetical protein n=1 Tax=Enterococcus avium TaxID=33945 RepID=UPI00288EB4DF|nr:hypothetical protein [Enterococcus avium]MDT2565172.1 hypothetical protein [Enterococcus avium]
MDLPNPPYSKELIATSEIIRKTISPTLAIVNEMNPVSETIRSYMEQNSILNSKYLLDNPFMKVIEERNRALAKMVPSSVLAIQKGLNLPSSNTANQIAASVPKWDFSGITKAYKPNIIDLSKCDFRISVLSQEVEKDLSTIASKELTDPNDKLADFYEKIQSDLSIQKKQANDQTDKLDELKLMIVSIAEKISNFENDTRNNKLDKDQSDIQTRQILKKKIKTFIFAFYFVCEFVEHSETAYQLFIWLKNILSGIIHLMNLSN